MINVHVNKLYNTGSASFDRDPGERSNVGLVQRRGGPSKCLSCSALLVERWEITIGHWSFSNHVSEMTDPMSFLQMTDHVQSFLSLSLSLSGMLMQRKTYLNFSMTALGREVTTPTGECKN